LLFVPEGGGEGEGGEGGCSENANNAVDDVGDESSEVCVSCPCFSDEDEGEEAIAEGGEGPLCC